jgi:hypothetical protein
LTVFSGSVIFIYKNLYEKEIYMIYKRGIYIVVLVLLLLPSISFSQSQEVKEYTIIRGDTLWGISGKELNDYFLWPQIWKENPGIPNPDKIYPGQTVKIPLYLLQKGKQEEPVVSQEAAKEQMPDAKPSTTIAEIKAKVPEPVQLKPLVGTNLLMASGYITDTVRSVGRVDGSPFDRIIFGNNDIIYLKTESPANIGDKFYITRAMMPVTHPVTGNKIGYLIEIRGIAEVFKFEYGSTKARILQMFDDIEVNDMLDTYYEVNPPLATGDFRKPDITGTVIAARSLHLTSGNSDIIYIDKGRRDGIEIGDVFQTVSGIGQHRVPNGTIQIINYKDSTATAIVRSFSDPIAAGNAVVKAE